MRVVTTIAGADPVRAHRPIGEKGRGRQGAEGQSWRHAAERDGSRGPGTQQARIHTDADAVAEDGNFLPQLHTRCEFAHGLLPRAHDVCVRPAKQPVRKRFLPARVLAVDSSSNTLAGPNMSRSSA